MKPKNFRRRLAWAGDRPTREERRRTFFLGLWEQVGDLYFYSPSDLEPTAISAIPTEQSHSAESDNQRTGLPDRSLVAPCAGRIEADEARGTGEGWNCIHCGSLFWYGNGCLLCCEPFCQTCEHTCEPTHENIGELLGVGRERVRQIEQLALYKIRTLLRQADLEAQNSPRELRLERRALRAWLSNRNEHR